MPQCSFNTLILHLGVLLYRDMRWSGSDSDLICPEVWEVIVIGGVDGDSLYMIGFVEYYVSGLKNGMSTRYPYFVGFRIIKIGYKYPFDGFVLTSSLYCLGNEGPALAFIGV